MVPGLVTQPVGKPIEAAKVSNWAAVVKFVMPRLRACVSMAAGRSVSRGMVQIWGRNSMLRRRGCW